MPARKKGKWGGMREGSGRPRGTKKPNPRRNRLVVLLSDDELDALKKAAAGQPVSTYVRSELLRGLKRDVVRGRI